jgi:hypothetical protein
MDLPCGILGNPDGWSRSQPGLVENKHSTEQATKNLEGETRWRR